MRVPASDSDADIWEFIKRECQTLYHPTSTCAIGSVVDPQLGVLGLEAMRVADTSVMPRVIRGTSTRRRPGSVTNGSAPSGGRSPSPPRRQRGHAPSRAVLGTIPVSFGG